MSLPKQLVIMFDVNILNPRLLNVLSEIQSSFDGLLICGGKGLNHPENVHRLKEDHRLFLYNLNIIFQNSGKLRNQFISYYKQFFDFSRIAYIRSSAKKEDKIQLDNPNIRCVQTIKADKNIQWKLYKFYKINESKVGCLFCRGSGEEVNYDQCGCVDWVTKCINCSGRGYNKELSFK